MLAGDIYATPPWVGRGGWTWYTGSAAWVHRFGIEAILGLRKQEGRLRVDPCIPPERKGFEAWVRVGSEEVHIVVENPNGVSRGVASITLDGSPLDSNWVPVETDARNEAKRRELRVRLGVPSMAGSLPVQPPAGSRL